MGIEIENMNQEIAQKWINAFNTKDIEALLNLYHVEAIHYSPKLKVAQPLTNGFIKGHSALREWWQGAFDRLPELHYHATNFISNEQFVFIEYIRKVPGEDDIKVGEVLEIENQKIIASRVYHG